MLSATTNADGTRQNRAGEPERCAEVRAIFENIDWPCNVHKNYSDRNLGCKTKISSGLDWVFREVEDAIILEDDCLPDISFFRFCEEMNEEAHMNCKICHHESEKKFEAVILYKYTTSYFSCPACGFVQTGEPVWLEEAYKEAINSCDTGILSRNIRLRESVATILYYFYDRKASYLDYAGGYGIFTRLMRDVGFDFYWCDKYTKNIVSQGFEYDNNLPISLVTAFEVMEHLVDPLDDLEKMLSISRNILFTTALIPNPLPAPHEWWYYGVEHGQHISFYTRMTLEKIAQSFGLHYHAFEDLHLMTEKVISPLKLSLIRKCLRKFHLFERVQKKMKSRTMADMYHVISLTSKA